MDVHRLERDVALNLLPAIRVRKVRSAKAGGRHAPSFNASVAPSGIGGDRGSRSRRSDRAWLRASLVVVGTSGRLELLCPRLLLTFC